MREIKFRAWDKEWKAMSESMELFNNGQSFFFFPGFGSRCPNHNKIEVNQYTGIKDKNGVEVYEGDVFNLGDKNINYVVEWIDTGLKARQIGNRSLVGLEYWRRDIERIGNIYENPEMLK